MKSLSITANKLIGQAMFKFMARANELERRGRRIIHFEIGDPDFDSPQEAISAAGYALTHGFTHYTDSMGILGLRQAIASKLEQDLGFKPGIDQILVAPANALIDFTIRCVANNGDEIIMPDPGFPTYQAVAVAAGMKPVGIPLRQENGFRIDPQDLRKAITKKTRLIIINSPHNPTGSCLHKEEILKIARLAQKQGIYLLSDEVYSKIIYSGRHYSCGIYDKCKIRTVVIGSMSKIYSMAGWRVGFAVGPKKLIEKAGLLLQTVISCLPAFTQMGALAALKKCDALIQERVKILQERRDILVDELNSLPGISCMAPEGAYYAFANIKNTGMSPEKFSEKMLKGGVCILPGDYFGKHGRGFMRFCFASTPVNIIKEAVNKMKTVLGSKQ